MALTIYVGFDLPVEFLRVSGNSIPYRSEIFIALGLILLIINIRRTIRRWMGMRIVGQIKRFSWNVEISKERKLRVIVYTLLESLVFFFLGTALYTVSNEAWLPAIAFWFASADNLLFLLVGLIWKKFRSGITSKAIIMSDRDVQLIYFSGLRKVSIHQQTIYFDYIKGLQMSIPVDIIPDKDKHDFFQVLESKVDRDKVFFSHTK